MATLEGQKICDSYKDLLQVSNSGSGLDSTLRRIESGAGTLSACFLSTNYFKIGDTGEPCTIELAPGSTAIGFPENTGPQGAQGTAGGAGAQGSAGPQGPAGTGAQGAQGPAGTGAQGAQGAQGTAGSAGGAGAQGAQGSGGSSPTFSYDASTKILTITS